MLSAVTIFHVFLWWKELQRAAGYSLRLTEVIPIFLPVYSFHFSYNFISIEDKGRFIPFSAFTFWKVIPWSLLLEYLTYHHNSLCLSRVERNLTFPFFLLFSIDYVLCIPSPTPSWWGYSNWVKKGVGHTSICSNALLWDNPTQSSSNTAETYPYTSEPSHNLYSNMVFLQITYNIRVLFIFLFSGSRVSLITLFPYLIFVF